MQATLRLIAAGALLSPASPAPSQEVPPGEEIDQEVVVTGNLPRCRVRPGDPLDEVDVDRAAVRQSVIQRDAAGTWSVTPDDHPVTGPDLWQRGGVGFADFRFRAPLGDNPMCIGSWRSRPRGWGAYRRILDAVPLHGRYVRFTAFVTTRRANQVRFWLAAGNGRRVLQGGDTSSRPIWGTRQWIPVSLTIGPIPRAATKLSYGFLLHGTGDVWVAQPNLEILDDARPNPDAAGLTRP